MNGEFNPNEKKMGNFGKGKNYTKASGGDVSVQEVLSMQNDPYKQKMSKWEKQSQEQYKRKQKEIAAEQAKFMPDTFKKTHMKKVDIAPQQNQSNNNNMNKNQSNNNANNFQPPSPQKQSQPQQQQKRQKQPQPQQSNNSNNNKPAPQSMPVPKQQKNEPYYNKPKPDPFAKFVNNSNFKNQLKNQGGYDAQKNNKNNMNHNKNHNKNKENKNQNVDINHNVIPKSNESNKFPKPIEALMCTQCGGKILDDSWTEDSSQRPFHDKCFVCSQCGIALGTLGRYVVVGRSMICKPCRSKQGISASQQQNQ